MKFRRKQSEAVEQADGEQVEEVEFQLDEDLEEGDQLQMEVEYELDMSDLGVRAFGPYDVDEVEFAEVEQGTVDLGGLIIRGMEGFELRMQVDESTGEVAAVLLANDEGAVELRPFAAPREGDMWSEVRRDIAAEATRRGGTATESEGRFGTELRVAIPVTTPEGQAATQPSRILGFNGPRWILRATMLGKPALQPEQAGPWESALRGVIVNRGAGAMAPGDAIPLTLPPSAQPVG